MPDFVAEARSVGGELPYDADFALHKLSPRVVEILTRERKSRYEKIFMKTRRNIQNTGRLKAAQPRLSKAELDRLVEEAIVDCYNESEQATGLYTMIEENLRVPFETEVLGVPVIVTRVDITEGDQIVAVCKRGSEAESADAGATVAQSSTCRV